MLERLNLLKSEFLQGQLEFRTALMEINGSSLSGTVTTWVPPRTKALATEIYNNEDRLDRLITWKCSELDRTETSRGSLMIEPVDLNGTIIARETGKVKHNMSGALFASHRLLRRRRRREQTGRGRSHPAGLRAPLFALRQ